MEWKTVENSNEIKPDSVFSEGNIIRVRKDFTLIPAGEESPAHWQYLECRMPAEAYGLYVQAEQQRADIDYIAMETGVGL